MEGLFWSVSEESGRLQPIPASPLLLPALAIAGALALWEAIRGDRRNVIPMPEDFNQKEYDYNKKREQYLIYKKYTLQQELTPQELHELNYILPYPTWSKGENWTYR